MGRLGPASQLRIASYASADTCMFVGWPGLPEQSIGGWGGVLEAGREGVNILGCPHNNDSRDGLLTLSCLVIGTSLLRGDV